MAVDTDAYERWKLAQCGASCLPEEFDYERSCTSPPLAHSSQRSDTLESQTLFETASLLSEGTRRGSFYTDHKSNSDSTYPNFSPLHTHKSRAILTVTRWTTVIALGAAVSMISAPALARSLLRYIGFHPGGITPGSWATLWQSKIGNVTTGSLFSVAQTIAAGASLPASWYATAAAIGGMLGMWGCLVVYFVARLVRALLG